MRASRALALIALALTAAVARAEPPAADGRWPVTDPAAARAMLDRLRGHHVGWHDGALEIVDVAGAGRPWVGVVERRGDELVAAEDKLRAAEMPLHVQIARQCRGELLGGAAGATLREDAAAWLRDQAVADPQAFARLILPRP